MFTFIWIAKYHFGNLLNTLKHSVKSFIKEKKRKQKVKYLNRSSIKISLYFSHTLIKYVIFPSKKIFPNSKFRESGVQWRNVLNSRWRRRHISDNPFLVRLRHSVCWACCGGFYDSWRVFRFKRFQCCWRLHCCRECWAFHDVQTIRHVVRFVKKWSVRKVIVSFISVRHSWDCKSELLELILDSISSLVNNE